MWGWVGERMVWGYAVEGIKLKWREAIYRIVAVILCS